MASPELARVRALRGCLRALMRTRRVSSPPRAALDSTRSLMLTLVPAHRRWASMISFDSSCHLMGPYVPFVCGRVLSYPFYRGGNRFREGKLCPGAPASKGESKGFEPEPPDPNYFTRRRASGSASPEVSCGKGQEHRPWSRAARLHAQERQTCGAEGPLVK